MYWRLPCLLGSYTSSQFLCTKKRQKSRLSSIGSLQKCGNITTPAGLMWLSPPLCSVLAICLVCCRSVVILRGYLVQNNQRVQGWVPPSPWVYFWDSGLLFSISYSWVMSGCLATKPHPPFGFQCSVSVCWSILDMAFHIWRIALGFRWAPPPHWSLVKISWSLVKISWSSWGGLVL